MKWRMLLLISAALMLAACGRSPRPSGEQPPGQDAALDPLPDAGSVDLPDGGLGADAASSDAPGGPGADAASPDAFDGGEATVIVAGDFGPGLGLPEPGVSVMFHSGDGRLIASTTTDANGKASALIPHDAMVTVVRRIGSMNPDTDVVTRTSVQPGATLLFGPNHSAPKTIATMTVTWTTPPNSFIGHFDVVTPCGSAFAFADERSATLAISDLCANTTFPVYVIARDNADFINQSGLDNQTAVDGGVIHLTTWQGATLVSSEVTDLPAGVSVFGSISQAPPGGFTFQFDNRELFAGPDSGTLVYRLAPVPSSELREDLQVNAGSLDEVVSRRWPFATSHTLDLGATLVPPITTAGFDVASHTLTWATGAPAMPDVQVLNLTYERHITQIFRWSVIGPRDLGSSFTIPQLPAELLDLMPLATDVITGVVSQVRLGNGLTFAQVESNIMQWLFAADPSVRPVAWNAAPANLDIVVESNASF